MTAPIAWYQLRDLERMTGVPRRTLRSWAEAGALPHVQLDAGARRLYGPEALRWLEARGIPVRHPRPAEPAQPAEPGELASSTRPVPR